MQEIRTGLLLQDSLSKGTWATYIDETHILNTDELPPEYRPEYGSIGVYKRILRKIEARSGRYSKGSSDYNGLRVHSHPSPSLRLAQFPLFVKYD